MAATKEAVHLGDDVEDQFFCTPESPKDDDELQAFFSYKGLRDEKSGLKPSSASDPYRQQMPADDVKALEPPEDSTSRTFASFGGNGTTASVSAYGGIMQIAKYFGVGKSGFFCVDLPDQLEPWFVTGRAWNLLDYSTDDQQRIGLLLLENWKEKPRLDFVHDRWPRYQGETEHLSITIQYTIRDGIVIQKYNIHKKSESSVTFQINNKGVAIRQMEWLDAGNRFNMQYPSDTSTEDQDDDQPTTHRPPYQVLCGLDKRSLNLIHHFDGLVKEKEEQEDKAPHRPSEESQAQSSNPGKISAHHSDATGHKGDEGSDNFSDEKEGTSISNESREPEAVGLVIAVFVNDKAQQFEDNGSMSVHMPEDSESLEITIAYRLQLLSSHRNGWKSSLISASEICKPPLYRTRNHSPVSFSQNRHLDFTIRRNLEHTLSVCAINTATEFVWNPNSQLFVESLSKVPAFALTCGDFAGHYIASSASFFAFRFLLEIFKFLKNQNLAEQPHASVVGQRRDTSRTRKEPTPQMKPIPQSDAQRRPAMGNTSRNELMLYSKEQRDRIFNVCKGHLTWVFEHAWKEDQAHFGGNHWASGDQIVFPFHWSSGRRSPPSLADTPFQIIKAFEFAKCWSDDENPKQPSNMHAEAHRQEASRQIPANSLTNEQSTKPDHGSEDHAGDKASDLLEPVAAQGLENDKILQSKPDHTPTEPNNSENKAAAEFNALEFAKSLVKNKVKPWVNDLALKNKRMRFAFSRSTENGVSNFRLEDHVWIWMALRCLEEFELDAELKPDSSPLLGHEQSRKITSKDAQRNMLRRFTLEETFLKQRLLATSRTVRESRFLFRSRDTALFYAMKQGFFGSDQSKMAPPWINSIETQKLHEHNDDAQWENPLRYGLAMVMSSNRRWQMNHKPANRMFSEAAMVLLYSARSNGLFLGEFDQETKEPAMFSEQYYRNSYWNTCFELPYILWMYGKPSLDKTPGIKPRLPVEKKGRKTGDRLQAAQSTATYVHEGAPASPVQPLDGTTEGVSHIRGESEIQSKPESSAQKRARDTQAAIDALTVKKTMPFNDFIDQKSVVEPSDDWLYSFPDFLDFDPEVATWDNIKPKVTGLLDIERPDRHFSTDNLIADSARIFHQTFEKTDNAQTSLDDEFPDKSDDILRGAIVDIPKSKQRRKGSPGKSDDADMFWYLKTNRTIWAVLKGMRTEQMAKKRIVWLPYPNKETALLCYLGSPESQHDAMMDFFDRHYSYEHYFFDDTIAVQNIWETELHLPFYQLLGNESNAGRETGFLPQQQEITSPALLGKKIVRATIGFRFLGDFLDRYWTCHVVECIPGQRYDGQNLGERTAQLTSGAGTWKQRKALELVLFDIVISEILNGVTDILQALFVREKRQVSLSGFSRNDYLILQDRSQSQRYILQVLEEDLKETLEQIESWKNREADRSQERPRWTKNDERKYRGPINKLLRSNERKIRKLKNHQTHIQSLRTELLNTQQQFRDDLNFLGAEDIKYFTYVTVVFLPLGFAASIFSMSEAPPGIVLISMVVTAVAALALTILALVSAKGIAGFVSAVSHGFRGLISSITSNSVLYQHYHHQNGQPSTTTNFVVDQGGAVDANQILPNIAHGLWLCWFWVAYITQELPGRQFEMMYRSWKLKIPSMGESSDHSAFTRWVISALNTAVWLLQIPLKLGILFAVTLTGLICWLAIGFKRLYSILKYPLAFMIAVVFAPVFAISYAINLMWLNVYDTALWSARKKSTESRENTTEKSLPKERTEEAPTRVSTQRSSRSESEKTIHHEEPLDRFLVYSKATRPFQKHVPEERPDGEDSGDGESAMDMRKAMKNVFGKPPAWPERKRAFGPFSV